MYVFLFFFCLDPMQSRPADHAKNVNYSKASHNSLLLFQSSSPMTVFVSSASSPGILSSCPGGIIKRSVTRLNIEAVDIRPEAHGVNLDERLFDELDSLEQVLLLDDQGRGESDTIKGGSHAS
jgi:hypothetical protein